MTAANRISQHQPVMAEQAMDLLSHAYTQGRGFSGLVVDGTVGGGGHARLILERLVPEGQLYCFDRDPAALETARAVLGKDQRVHLIHDSYANVKDYLKAETASAIILDLGLSSDQIFSDRGFSYRRDSILDMRFDPASEVSASDVVNHYTIARMREIFFKFGEEPLAPRIARRIAEVRAGGAIKTTDELAQVIREAVPQRFAMKALARIFQAIRIEVNREIEHLEKGIEACWKMLRVGGVLCVVSYHSIEDRRIKRFFATKAKGCICPPRLPVCTCGKKPAAKILTSSALRPQPKEIRLNPAARSARLRAAKRISQE